MAGRVHKEGLRLARLLMVLSSLSPLFLLWALRGVQGIPDAWLWLACLALIILPNFALWFRIRIARARQDVRTLTVGRSEDHREHLLVYLFAVLLPLYDANLGRLRDSMAALVAVVFIIFLLWHLNLHYINIAFAALGYRVFTVEPPAHDATASARHSWVLLTPRTYLLAGDQVRAFRISDTVYIELREAQ